MKMKKHTKVIDLLNTAQTQIEVTAKGWVRTFRNNQFIALNDGSTIHNIQCVVDFENTAEATLKRITTGAAVSVTGNLVESKGAGQKFEIQVTKLEILGDSDAEKFPMQPKKHSLEFLRENAHLRVRTNAFGAIMRVRSTLSFAVHQYFQEKGFFYVNTPIITGSDAEGAGEMFKVTALPFDNTPRTEEGKINYKEDFFGKETNLTVSGQLEAETYAMALGQVYTFGPTFRAENSNTSRHLAEFWMIEPEMAFYDIFQNMDCIEGFLQHVVGKVLEKCEHELETIGRDVSVLKSSLGTFPRMTYDQAVRIIKGEEDVNGVNSIKSLEEELLRCEQQLAAIDAEIAEREAKVATPGMKKGEINFHQTKITQLKQEKSDVEEDLRNIPQWIGSAKNFQYGDDFGGSDETVLTRLFDRPVMVYDWPHEVKAFYLKRNPEDARFARGVDVLAPEGYGEIVGGGERETDVDLLTSKIEEHQLPMEAFEWYLDLRRYGSVPHAGFGLGLERLVTWVCKLKHVRESIPFPRMYGRLTP